MLDEFDPLEAKQSMNTEVAVKALKREITNVLDSYVGWYDPFCELIQNSLDAVEERYLKEESDYRPRIKIIINCDENSLTVSDNGFGLSKEEFTQFLAPCVSFKSGNTRGHKGVGATYVGYGFNYIRIATKSKEFESVGIMRNSRKWLTNPNPPGNPKVKINHKAQHSSYSPYFDFGVSIKVKFDANTNPKNLKWIKAKTADQWFKILRIKTGLGAIETNIPIAAKLEVIYEEKTTTEKSDSIEYFWPHLITKKHISFTKLIKEEDKILTKSRTNSKIPSKLRNHECVYDTISYNDFEKFGFDLTKEEKEIVRKYTPCAYFAFMYSAKIWPRYNQKLSLREGYSILKPGIQIAADRMPQGEVIMLPLNRNIGRQNQIHLLFHFNDCKADLGRKGFQKELVDFSKSIGKKLVDNPLSKIRRFMKPVSGRKGNLAREKKVAEWKATFQVHEQDNPLLLKSDHFFLPTKKIAITSIPTREQDVIALFNQLIAGGVIRGIKIMSTNEFFTYDGMYRVLIEKPQEHHVYDADKNPLGIDSAVWDDYSEDNSIPLYSEPKILEYKYSLDGLIEDISSGVKNSNDIGLAIVWEVGQDYQKQYSAISLLDPDNIAEREYHGITHVLSDYETGEKSFDLIVLKDLVEYLNDPQSAIEQQREQYD